MKIVNDVEDVEVITLDEAKRKVERQINNTTGDSLYVIRYNGKLISISSRYYKFGYKTMGNLKNALSQKFGSDLAKALVENNVITLERWEMN